MKHEAIFSGELGKLPDIEVDVELEPDATTYHCQKPFHIPNIYTGTLKMEVNCLCDIDVVEPVDGSSEWAAPSFI
jgi:hypothetical protein